MKVRVCVDLNISNIDSCIGCSACRECGEYYEFCGVFGHCLNWKGTSWKPTEECIASRHETEQGGER